MIDTAKYEGLTIDDWYKMNHHDWKDVVNEHNDLLAEVKRLREQLLQGVMYMHMTSTQTKDGRIYNAEKFERQVREMIE